MKYFDLLPYIRTVVFAEVKDILSSPLDLLPFVSERINVIKLVRYIFFSTMAHIFSSVTATAASDALFPSASASVTPSIESL